MPHFCRLTCGPIGRSLRRALSTWSTNDCVIHSHWIYIQRPACTFNLSSSSSSVAGTAWSGLRRLAALLSTHRCEALTPPSARLSLHPSTPPVILHRLQPHAATEPVITLLLLSICDSTAAFSHLRVIPVRGLAVVHRLAAFGAAGQQTRVIGRGLYMESLTAGTHEVHGHTQGKFILIELEKNISSP